MRVYAETNKVLYTKATDHGWDIVKVKSESNPNRTYTVDMTHGRCSCPAWIHQKGGERKICKHLRKLGFKQLIQAAEFDYQEKVKTGQGQKVQVSE